VLSGLESPERSKPWNLQKGNVLVRKDDTVYENDACKRRTLKRDVDGGVTRYQWDCRDRLRSVVLPDGRLVEFTYDAFARRVRKTVTDAPKLPLAEALREALKHGAAEQKVTTTRFLWDGDVLCAELGEAGPRVHVHEPGSFVPLLQAEGGAVYSVVTDHLGMPKELLDASGKVAWAAAHSAWGRVVEVQRDEGAAQVESPFRLLGQYHDEETGLSYTRFRYFDAEAGRWCSPDPLGMLGGANQQGLDGAPNVVVDPLGLACPNKFPDDPNALTQQLGIEPRVSRTQDDTLRLRWQVSSRLRIRYESHPHGLDPNDANWNPRHHGTHYHIEIRVDPNRGWNAPGNVKKVQPEGYTPGSGTGFVPGETYPGDTVT